MTVYVREDSELDIDTEDIHTRDELSRQIGKGIAKFTWQDPRAEYSNLLRAFSSSRLDMNFIQYKRIDKVAYDKMISRCISIHK